MFFVIMREGKREAERVLDGLSGLRRDLFNWIAFAREQDGKV